MTPIKEIVKEDLIADMMLPGNAQDLCECINHLIDSKIENMLYFFQEMTRSQKLYTTLYK